MRKNRFSNLRSQLGMSMIEILIVVGIMSIIMLAMSTMQSNQFKETRALSEVLGSQDLQKLLTATLSDGAVCHYVVNNPAVLTFNAPAVSPLTPQTLVPVLPLYASYSVGPPVAIGPVVAQVGQSASAYSSTLIIKKISLSITNPPVPLLFAPGQNFTGHWIVDFDPAKTVRPVKPVDIATQVTVDATVPGAAKITACMGGAAPPPGNGVLFSKANIVSHGFTASPISFHAATSNQTAVAGSKFLILMTISSQVGGGATNVTVTVKRDGVQIYQNSDSNNGGYTDTHFWAYVDTPAPGPHTYDFYTGDSWGSGSWNGTSSFIIMETP